MTLRFAPVLAIGLAACGAPNDSGGPSTTTTTGTSTSTTNTTTSSSTGTSSTTTPTWEPATLVAGEAVVCADASLRTDRPFDRVEDAVWLSQQPPIEEDDKETRGYGMAVADFDGDGTLDIFLPKWGLDELYMGSPTALGSAYTEEGAKRLPPNTDRTHGASAADMDDDGDIDLILLNRGFPNRLYQNDGTGHFTELVGAFDPEAYFGSVSAAWGDIDGNGTLDVLVSNHFYDSSSIPNGDEPGDPNELYLGDGAGNFFDASSQLPVHAATGFTFISVLVDLDNDHDLDTYFVNDFGVVRQRGNFVMRNDTVPGGELAFYDWSQASGLDEPMEGMGASIGDLNGDGLIDFLVSSWAELYLFLSFGAAGWVEGAQAYGLILDPSSDDRYVAWGNLLEDLDNDGDLDAFVMFGKLAPAAGAADNDPFQQPDALYVNEGGSFTEQSAAWGLDNPQVGRGIVATDMNGDGFPDLVRRYLNAPAEIHLSRCDQSSWLEVSLAQPPPNVQAVGAIVDIEAGGTKQRRWVHIGSTGLASSVPPVAHFGLGGVETVDTLTVIWPDGTQSRVVDVPTRRKVLVQRGP